MTAQPENGGDCVRCGHSRGTHGWTGCTMCTGRGCRGFLKPDDAETQELDYESLKVPTVRVVDPTDFNAPTLDELATAAPVDELDLGGGMTMRYRETPPPMFQEGVTAGWLYEHTGKPGPARALPVVAMTDGEGVVSIEPDGEWQDVTVVDDREEA